MSEATYDRFIRKARRDAPHAFMREPENFMRVGSALGNDGPATTGTGTASTSATPSHDRDDGALGSFLFARCGCCLGSRRLVRPR